ncbi:hypothetical protein D3C78_1922150 [compost metagenome]
MLVPGWCVSWLPNMVVSWQYWPICKVLKFASHGLRKEKSFSRRGSNSFSTQRWTKMPETISESESTTRP